MSDAPILPTCGHNDCGPLYLHSRCHMGWPTWVRLEGNEAVVVCAHMEDIDGEIVRCEREVDRLRLAPKES